MSQRTDLAKEKLVKFFGPASNRQVDSWINQGMSEDEIIAKAKAKVMGLMGPKKAQELDDL